MYSITNIATDNIIKYVRRGPVDAPDALDFVPPEGPAQENVSRPSTTRSTIRPRIKYYRLFITVDPTMFGHYYVSNATPEVLKHPREGFNDGRPRGLRFSRARIAISCIS